jgi:hypothetical protein
MKPAEKFEYHYKPETMNDGTDVAAKIELNRAKVIAADKRKLKIEESNRVKKNNSALDRLIQSMGQNSGDDQRQALDPKGGYFIEDEAKIPVQKP